MFAKGVSKELAQDRSEKISNVKYALSLKLDKGVNSCKGEIKIHFDLKGGHEELVLDFAGKTLYHLELNGRACDPVIRKNNHILVQTGLKEGKNEIQAAFSFRVGQAGGALTRFKDPSDGEEYVYTLFVPCDAHTLFPCFDQPDLKARLRLKLTLPKTWKAAANSPLLSRSPDGVHVFEESEPMSTYLMAFAAGPFERVTDPVHNQTSFYVRASKLKKTDPQALFDLHRTARDFLETYLDCPYPFSKFDFVLAPAFPYGGMEHPGAIFYRESMLAFDAPPTDKQLLKRSVLIFHEFAHQWFGDYVTMEWFDDLWIKEGFATFLSYKILEQCAPGSQAWKRFSQQVTPAAYRMEMTRGTTPIFQELDNLGNAKSTYSAIVYNKAPAILKQLEFFLGVEPFREALKLLLKRFPYGTARWRDFIDCCEQTSNRELGPWAQAWILRKGMPITRVLSQGEEEGITLSQEGVRDKEAFWPFKTRLALIDEKGNATSRDLFMEGKKAKAPGIAFSDRIAMIFANHQDFAYGRFPLDSKSLKAVEKMIPRIQDPFLKSQLFDTLWDMTRNGEYAPLNYIRLAMEQIGKKSDPLDCDLFLSKISSAMSRYLSLEQRKEMARDLETRLRAMMGDGGVDKSLKLACFRAFVRMVCTEDGQDWLKSLLNKKTFIQDVPLTPKDRWRMVKRLILLEHKDSQALFDQEKVMDKSVDTSKYCFETRSAFPDPDIKAEYFKMYLNKTEIPESWLEASLDGFNGWGQRDLTLPFLKRALDQIQWTKENRKIFFLQKWLNSFISSQCDGRAVPIVEAFLRDHGDLSQDLKGKIFQSLDTLLSTLKVRERWF